MDLFADDDAGLMPIPIDDGALAFQQRLRVGLDGDPELAPERLLQLLMDETAWRVEHITLYGKTHAQPRLSAWYGEASYRYSGMTMHPLPFTPLQLAIKAAVELATGRRFNSVLLNYYRDERDSMGFHSDDESELGPEPAIASVSYGSPRTFILKHKRLPKTIKLSLGDGSLLLMAGALQQHWRHGINKERTARGPRINLTFRDIR